ELGGAVGFGLLAHQYLWDSNTERQCCRHRNSAELEACEQFSSLGDKRCEQIRYRLQQHGIGFELVLVEVDVRHLPGAQHELTGQPASVLNGSGQIVSVHSPIMSTGERLRRLANRQVSVTADGGGMVPAPV